MPDLEMSWSGDLSVSATGDLATVNDPALGTERVLRRLMTNPGDYIWNPEYGAGLGQFVGHSVDLAGIEALIRAQMALEPAVSSTPEPIISASSDVTGRLYMQIRYEDSFSAVSAVLNTSVPG